MMKVRKPRQPAQRSRSAIDESKTGIVGAHLLGAVPSEVFNTFWFFAAKRQQIFFSRLEGNEPPWTDDPILSEYKFTNAYRASDRVSQFLIRNVIYSGTWQLNDMFFRILLFKLFNKIETWKLLEHQFGDPCFTSYRYSDYDRVLTRALVNGRAIYSAAYIMAAGNKALGLDRKHQAHLCLLERMIKENVPNRLQNCKTMRDAFEVLLSYPMIGRFLAYQLITDINYSQITMFNEMEFTEPGPGARDGIRKCFASLGNLSEIDVIRMMAERQEVEFALRGIKFRNLWGRQLQLIDMQNLFCEVDKYARIRHPTVVGLSGRTRIKQKFRETPEPIEYFYPPKWGISAHGAIAHSSGTRQGILI